MSAAVEFVRRMPVLIFSMVIVGALLGGAVAPAIQAAFEEFDASNPVVILAARVVSSDSDEIVIHLSGEKVRACQYIGLTAYTRKAGGALSDAYIRRIGGEKGATRPLGDFPDMGLWRVWPSDGAKQVLIYAQHSCSGRLVLSAAPAIQVPAK